MSSIAWLDFDSRQNDRMNQILKLFEESNTLDELGIGNIRDAFANLLFPGTSTVQTRLRYFLITGWIYRRMEAEKVPPSEVAKRVASLERDLIDVILEGGERKGVFGRVSGRSLKMLPSAIYWSGLASWGFVRSMSRSEYHRKFDLFWWGETDTPSAWPHFPNAPESFPDELALDLTKEEADFVRSRVATHQRGSLLHVLMTDEDPPVDVDRIWQHPDLNDWSPDIQRIVRHARQFSVYNEGANALYNFMLASELEHDDWAAFQRANLEAWRKRWMQLPAWEVDEMWFILAPAGFNLDMRTQEFVSAWHAAVTETNGFVEESKSARALIEAREVYKKGNRSRFRSRSRLSQWHGGSPPTLLDYRWRATVRQMLTDLVAGSRGESAGEENDVIS
jgi:hypothetical protein